MFEIKDHYSHVNVKWAILLVNCYIVTDNSPVCRVQTNKYNLFLFFLTQAPSLLGNTQRIL